MRWLGRRWTPSRVDGAKPWSHTQRARCNHRIRQKRCFVLVRQYLEPRFEVCGVLSKAPAFAVIGEYQILAEVLFDRFTTL